MKKAIGFLLLSCTFILGASPKSESTMEPPTQVFTAEITYLEGEVFINGEPAEFGDIVEADSTLSTSVNSYCELVFLDQNIIRIQENSLVRLDLNLNQSRVELEQGSMAALMNKLRSITDDEPLLITTPTVTAGIRGTAFFVAVENPDSTYFCACNGVIDVRDYQGDNQQTLDADRHKAVRYRIEEGEIIMESAGLLYHDDESMDSLAEELDYQIPWSSY